MNQPLNDYGYDGPEAAASPAPGTPQTGTKAYVATALSFVAAFVGIWVADVDPFTAKEIAAGAVYAGTASGLIGGATYLARNKAKA